jgi:hypothetical protein
MPTSQCASSPNPCPGVGELVYYIAAPSSTTACKVFYQTSNLPVRCHGKTNIYYYFHLKKNDTIRQEAAPLSTSGWSVAGWRLII